MRRWVLFASLVTLVVVLVVVPSSASAASRHSCWGTVKKPGMLAGSYRGSVVVRGVCTVGKRTIVRGSVRLERGSALLAFKDLIVRRNVKVRRGATLIAGQDPDQSGAQAPRSVFHVHGNLLARGALGVVLHEGVIDGNVRQVGGGGGVTCQPLGIFKQFGSPVFSVYEGMKLGGNLKVARLRSCWFGITHNKHIRGSVRVVRNRLADPDAIEILDNTIRGDLVCRKNSMAWDSADTVEGQLYPRQWEPNTVNGKRKGQCVVAPPLTQGGNSPGPF